MENNKITETLNKNYISLSRVEWFVVIVLLTLALITPALFTQLPSFVSFHNTGQIGDTIGGITAPFINILAAFLVYKSFDAQIRANLDQRRSHKIEMDLIREEQIISNITNVFKAFEDSTISRSGYYNQLVDRIHEFETAHGTSSNQALKDDEVTKNQFYEYLVDLDSYFKIFNNDLKLLLHLAENLENYSDKYQNKSFTLLYNTKIAELLVGMQYSKFDQSIDEIISAKERLEGHSNYLTMCQDTLKILIRKITYNDNSPIVFP